MRALLDADELDAACGGDALCRWAAQGLAPGVRAFASDDGAALAIAAPGLSMRDRLAIRGPVERVAPLVREALALLGPTYRPLGAQALVEAVAAAVPGLAVRNRFGWMERGRDGPALPAADGGAWLSPADAGEVAALLDLSFPGSYARPGRPPDARWAGVRDARGVLRASAALAWSAPAVGLVAGVAVHPGSRGAGLGCAVSAFVVAEALSRHGTAALMVDDVNAAAIRTYRACGLAYRSVAAATQVPCQGAGR